MAKRNKPQIKYIAVRWPEALRRDLKVAAASADLPRTMTEYLQGCFELIQACGGLDACLQTGRKVNAK